MWFSKHWPRRWRSGKNRIRPIWQVRGVGSTPTVIKIFRSTRKEISINPHRRVLPEERIGHRGRRLDGHTEMPDTSETIRMTPST
uniref:Uncharacterized protein n=1 Tax=Panagrellus redivivus TaxID=6233 RepID=A0A7E4UQC5_PANRE